MDFSPLDLARRAMRLQDPGDALKAIVALRSALQGLEELHVENALAAGWTWADVGAALGTTKQGAHKRHADRIQRARGEPSGDLEKRSRVMITAEARRCVALARRAAESLARPAVRTEHLLLGLLGDPTTLACRALNETGVALDTVWRIVGGSTAAAGPRETGSSALPISTHVREVLERALPEAIALGDSHLGAEHILLALLRASPGGAARILAALGAEPARVEAALERLRGAAGASAGR